MISDQASTTYINRTPSGSNELLATETMPLYTCYLIPGQQGDLLCRSPILDEGALGFRCQDFLVAFADRDR